MSYRRKGLGLVTSPAGTLAPAGGKTTDRTSVLSPAYVPRFSTGIQTPTIRAAPIAQGAGVFIADPDLRPPEYCSVDRSLLYAGRYTLPPSVMPAGGVLVMAQEVLDERSRGNALGNQGAVARDLRQLVNAHEATTADGRRKRLTYRAGGIGGTPRVIYWLAVEAPAGGMSWGVLSQVITGKLMVVGRRYGIAVGPSSPVYVPPSGRTGPRHQDLWEAALFSVGALSDLVAGLRVGFRRGSIDDQARSMINGTGANFEAVRLGTEAVQGASGTAARAVAMGEAALRMEPAALGRDEIQKARKLIDDEDAKILRAEEMRARGGLRAMAESVGVRVPGLVRAALEREVTAFNRDSRFSEVQRLYATCEYYKQASALYAPLKTAIVSLIGQANELERAWDAVVPLISNARGAFTAARAQLDEFESRLDLPWYLRKLGPLPVWGWGLIGVGVLGGGGILIARGRRRAA